MTDIIVGSEWDFAGEKVKVIATSDMEVAFQYLKDNKFDRELLVTWNQIAQPWKDQKLSEKLIFWHEKLAEQYSNISYFHLINRNDVGEIRDLMLKAAVIVERCERKSLD